MGGRRGFCPWVAVRLFGGRHGRGERQAALLGDHAARLCGGRYHRILDPKDGHVRSCDKGGAMKSHRILLIAAMIAVSAAAQGDPWAALRVFEGKWEGPVTGKPGKQFSSREYKFELNGKFLSQQDKSVYEPKSPGAKPDVREDFGFFSYDTILKKIVWRQFHSEGFVNEYRLESVSTDGKALEFVTVRIEN